MVISRLFKLGYERVTKTVGGHRTIFYIKKGLGQSPAVGEMRLLGRNILIGEQAKISIGGSNDCDVRISHPAVRPTDVVRIQHVADVFQLVFPEALSGKSNLKIKIKTDMGKLEKDLAGESVALKGRSTIKIQYGPRGSRQTLLEIELISYQRGVNESVISDGESELFLPAAAGHDQGPAVAPDDDTPTRPLIAQPDPVVLPPRSKVRAAASSLDASKIVEVLIKSSGKRPIELVPPPERQKIENNVKKFTLFDVPTNGRDFFQIIKQMEDRAATAWLIKAIDNLSREGKISQGDDCLDKIWQLYKVESPKPALSITSRSYFLASAFSRKVCEIVESLIKSSGKRPIEFVPPQARQEIINKTSEYSVIFMIDGQTLDTESQRHGYEDDAANRWLFDTIINLIREGKIREGDDYLAKIWQWYK